MSGYDPNWRPGNRAVREQGGGGPGNVQGPAAEVLEAEAEDHTVWIRGRVIKQDDGGWKRTEGRISKRIYPA